MRNPFEEKFAVLAPHLADHKQAYAAGIAEGVLIAKNAIQKTLGEAAYTAIHPELSGLLTKVVLTASMFADPDIGRELLAAHRHRLTPAKAEP